MCRFFIILFTFFALSGSFTYSVAQNKAECYWFYISTNKNTDEGYNGKIITINKISNDISSGSFQDFTKSHKSSLDKGEIAVGPFKDYKIANLSKKIYGNMGKNRSEMESNKELYMFLVKPLKLEEKGEIRFETIPARVSKCTENLFAAVMGEVLSFEKLAVGPFSRYDMAEKAKYTFLKNGSLYEPNKEDSLNVKKLVTMKRKWTKLKMSVVTRKKRDKKGKSLYRFNAHFPRRYFASEAVQVLLISPVYGGNSEQFVHGISLQGSDIMDNNRVISSEKSTNYSEILYFNPKKGTVIKGFTVKGFIYNQTALIELPERSVKFKN